MAEQVESYQDIAFDGAWKGRSRAMWATAAVGLAYGAAMGLAAPVFPWLTGAAITTHMVAQSVAIFSAVGMTGGFGVGAVVGNAAAGAAAVAKEQERRFRENAGERSLGMSQGAAQEEPKPLKRLWQKLSDGKDRYFNPRVAIAFGALRAIGGLVMAAAFWALTIGAPATASSWMLPAMQHFLGMAPTATEFTAYFAGVMGCFGASFGINVPKIVTAITHYTGDLLGGAALGTSWEKNPQKAPETSLAPDVLPEPPQPKMTMRKYESYQELIARQAAEPASGITAKR